jgi:hypothetical protein
MQSPSWHRPRLPSFARELAESKRLAAVRADSRWAAQRLSLLPVQVKAQRSLVPELAAPPQPRNDPLKSSSSKRSRSARLLFEFGKK